MDIDPTGSEKESRIWQALQSHAYRITDLTSKHASNPDDLSTLAGLCQQLGYPTTVSALEARLREILQDPDHAIFVAEAPDGSLCGWIDIYRNHLMVKDPFAELGGLVVDAEHRGQGIGQALLVAAEGWARGKSLTVIRIRSNIVRDEAHAFYHKLGYSVEKTQYALIKSI